jgi:threonylcarbamoyladenosine tRNA methylthiotransferase MtaB
VKYAVVTFGCRVNQADSLAFEAELAARGGVAVPSDRADLVIVNTCSVTASADQGARQTIRRIARENPAARIVATGCYATRCADEVAALAGVAEVVPNGAKDAVAVVSRLLRSSGDAIDVSDGPCGRPVPGLMGRTAWTLRVQTGCEESCSYCIIPTTRGASRSRTLDEVRADVARAAEAGYKEIVITGVHLGSYGRDLRPATSLAALLVALDETPHDVLFRISSLEPMDVPHELVDLAEAGERGGGRPGPRVAPHFHLPLQHASNRVLRLMRRPYTIEEYAALVEDIRHRLPHAAIGSDVIVGFPGERDEDFQTLIDYLERSPLTHLHVFPYSDRPGTVAANLPDKIHGTVTKERAQRVREMSRSLHERFRVAQLGTVRPALTIEDGAVAITDNYVRVPVAPGHARNELVFARL